MCIYKGGCLFNLSVLACGVSSFLASLRDRNSIILAGSELCSTTGAGLDVIPSPILVLTEGLNHSYSRIEINKECSLHQKRNDVGLAWCWILWHGVFDWNLKKAS